MEENLQHLGNIARSIINDEEFILETNGFKWTEFSFIFDIDEDGDLTGISGYAYDDTKAYCAATADFSNLEHPVENYRAWLSKDTDKGFMKMLFQFNRDSGQVQADFEYDDPMRWKVTPNNIDDMIEELRPNLGE